MVREAGKPDIGDDRQAEIAGIRIAIAYPPAAAAG
jgi:hypothetical protein